MVRWSLSSRCSGETNPRKSLMFSDAADRRGGLGKQKRAMLSQQTEDVRVLMSQQR
jgi:hypothetical protein